MADYLIAKHTLKIVIAQICQNIGWHAVQSSPMDILVDVLQRYVVEISKSVHQYSNQYNRTEPNLDDLGLTFKDFGINLQDIGEYINNVDSVPPLFKVASFPVKHPSNLQHPKPDSRELFLRPEHIPDYLPLMHPDLEEDVAFNQQSTVDGVKKNSLETSASGDSPSPLSSPKHGLKRNDWPSETSNKKSRYYTEEEGRPMREVTSVFMTPAGFISPVHEGKTAEASLPCLVDSPPPTPELPSHSFSSVKKDVKFKEVKKDKSSKPKKDKEASKKDVKKLKSSKKEKENKENAVGKHEKAVTSSSSKKEHSSSHKSGKVDKSMKSEDPVRQKSKSDKMKLKAQKDEIRKAKESFKLSKMKAKLKHSGGSSSSSHMKSSKLSSSKKLKAAKVAKSIKHFKGEKIKTVEPLPPPPVPTLPKEITFEQKLPPPPPPPEPKVEKEIVDELMEDEDLDFREESPEPRLVIDDSLETQARQERESRLEVIDECIEAVIRRGEEESEVENKAMEETINAVVRGPVMKKLEPKDIYDFTDTSDSSSLSSCDIAPHSPIQAPVKKEKKTNESNKKSSESPKRNKKEKLKKKGNKESKSKSPNPYTSPKGQKSSNFILKVEDRTPSPILKDDLLSSDGSTPSSSPRSNTFFDHSPQAPGHIHAPPLLSHVPPLPPPFVPSSSYTSSPFAPMRSLPCHTNPHFPTPPLFVTPAKSESGSTFQNMQPLNLAKSGPSSLKSSPEKFESSISHSSHKAESSDLIKKAANIIDKSKAKDHKKDKLKKKGKKESEKVKEKKEKEEIKEKEDEKKKTKAKEKPKTKIEKASKIEKKKSKPEKKKVKEKEEKIKEDSTVPKMTLKLGGSGSTKIFVKPNTKNSASLSSSPSPPHNMEEDIIPSPSPSPPPRVATPSPPREPTPPPPPRIPTPPPPTPSPPPPVIKEVKEETPPPAPPPPITKTQHSRGRGRGKKAAAQAVIPPARTVITETLGTIVDESGNKIWICPACSRADDGSPMIGCDECDDWYHWVCVGIVVPPKEEENWFCVRCIAKRQGPNIKRRRKKHKKDK